jgi:hypothetical protein
MNLEALGRQYATEADTLAGMVESCKERRRAALNAGNSREAIRQENLAESHDLQRNDLLEIAAHLKHYYEPGTEAVREEKQPTDLKG